MDFTTLGVHDLYLETIKLHGLHSANTLKHFPTKKKKNRLHEGDTNGRAGKSTEISTQ